MALRTKKGSELPPDAVAVSEKEALEYQKKFIRTWPSEMNVLFLKYGGFMTAATSIATSTIITEFFRQYFNLRFSPFVYWSYLSSSILPSLFSFFITEKFLTNEILLMKMDCPVCSELKFGVSQLYGSVAYPTILGYLSFSSRAQIEGTHYIPDIKTHPREFWSVTFSNLKKSTRILKLVTLSQFAWILFLPYMQNKELLNVMNEVKETFIN